MHTLLMYKVGPLYIEGHLINSDIYICLSIWLQKGEFANTLPRRTNIGGRGGGEKKKFKTSDENAEKNVFFSPCL